MRTLLAMGRVQEAKAFVAEEKYKVSAELRRRAAVAKESKLTVSGQDMEAQNLPDEDAVGDTYRIVRKNTDQFSSEKLLEDELSMRIDVGIPVFGKKLKIYRRHGEYGRQYIIPAGRLDLLAEDENGDLYVIELKKDSGYDDLYGQTAAYLDWFEKNHRKKGRKIYGIICLNNPGKQLIEKARADERM